MSGRGNINEGPTLAKALKNDGYNQTYIIQSSSSVGDTSNNREVFFRCGNWCYKGKVQFNDLEISLSNITILVSTLQKQQTSLRFDCNAVELPTSSVYYDPLLFFNDSVEFISSELTSDETQNELERMTHIFPWINDALDGSDDNNNKTYFELMLSEIPTQLKNVTLIASKTYVRGLVIVSVYFEGAIYFVLLPGEGDQGLLDVRFPDVSSHGHGCLLAFYGTSSETNTINLNAQKNVHRLDQNHFKDSKNHNNSYDDYGTHKDDYDDIYSDNLNTSTSNGGVNGSSHSSKQIAESKSAKHNQNTTKTSTIFKSFYKKLVLWQSFSASVMMSIEELNHSRSQPLKVNTTDLSSANYQQTYIILREPDRIDDMEQLATGRSSSSLDYDLSMASAASYRDVLFRFGSWCYTGRIRLVESLIELPDIPIMIPVLRAQQSALEFAYEVSEVPVNSPYSGPMSYIHHTVIPNVIDMIVKSEEALQNLIFRLTQMGLDHSVRSWLDNEDESTAGESFFEFSLSTGHETIDVLKDIEVIASKIYLPGGICAVCIIHQSTVYVCMNSLGDGDNVPLLDSKFPDVGGKGRGYILETTPNGTDAWPALRKMAIWQTAAALQREFMARSTITRTGGTTDSQAQPKRKWPALIKDKDRENDDVITSTTATITVNSSPLMRQQESIQDDNNNSSIHDDEKKVSPRSSSGSKISSVGQGSEDTTSISKTVSSNINIKSPRSQQENKLTNPNLNTTSPTTSVINNEPNSLSDSFRKGISLNGVLEVPSPDASSSSSSSSTAVTSTADSQVDNNSASKITAKFIPHHLPPLAAVAKSFDLLGKNDQEIAWDRITGAPLKPTKLTKK